MSDYEINNEGIELDRSCTCCESDICYWLANRVGCRRCYINTLKNDEQKVEAMDRWKETLSLLPRNFDSLHETDECQFCKGEKEKIDGYATFEMANPEPYFAKGMFFGFGKKVRTPVGSLVTVQAGVCKRCKKAFRFGDMVQIMGLIIGVVLGIILLMVPQIASPMYNLFALLPVIFLLLMGVAGYFIGKNAQTALYKKAAKRTKIDLAEIPIVAMMLSKNWFFFQTNNGMPRVAFSKKKQFGRMLRKQEENKSTNEDMPLDNMNI